MEIQGSCIGEGCLGAWLMPIKAENVCSLQEATASQEVESGWPHRYRWLRLHRQAPA